MKKSKFLQFWFMPNFILIDSETHFINIVLKVVKPIKIKGYQFSLVFNDCNIDFSNYLFSKLKCLELRDYAFIYHDKDLTENKHFHLYLHTKKQTTIKTLSKLFEIPPRQIELVGLRNKFLRYLIHVDQSHKHQYNVFEVYTNIQDYENIVSDCAFTTPNDYLQTLYNLLFSGRFKDYGHFVHFLMCDYPYLVETASKNAYALSLVIKNLNAHRTDI